MVYFMIWYEFPYGIITAIKMDILQKYKKNISVTQIYFNKLQKMVFMYLLFAQINIASFFFFANLVHHHEKTVQFK